MKMTSPKEGEHPFLFSLESMDLDFATLFVAGLLICLSQTVPSLNNLISSIQLTAITSRLSLLYILLIWTGWDDESPFALRPIHSVLFLISFLLLLLQLTYIPRVVLATLVLLFNPTLLFFTLLEFHYIVFLDFCTLLVCLHLTVIILFWSAYFLGDSNDVHHSLTQLFTCNLPLSDTLQFRSYSTLVTHAISNVLILAHIAYHHHYSFTTNSWYLVRCFFIIYFLILLFSCLSSYQLAQQYVSCLGGACRRKDFIRNPYLHMKLLSSRIILYENFQKTLGDSSLCAEINRDRVRHLLSNLFDRNEIKTFLEVFDTQDFIRWVWNHQRVYKQGFTFLAISLPYDGLYLNVYLDGRLGCWWKVVGIALTILVLNDCFFVLAVLVGK